MWQIQGNVRIKNFETLANIKRKYVKSYFLFNFEYTLLEKKIWDKL